MSTPAPKRKRSSGRRRKLKETVIDPLVVESRVQRLIEAIKCGVAPVDCPRWPAVVSEPLGTSYKDVRPSRSLMGAMYIAAIAEQRPGPHLCDSSRAWVGGDPDWDEPDRILIGLTQWEDGLWYGVRSAVLPYWYALPLVRRMMRDRKPSEPVNSESLSDPGSDA